MAGTIFNYIVNFCIYLFGVLQVLGTIGGLIFGVCWLLRPRPSDDQDAPQEIRCDSCVEHSVCPAADTGVAYPCPWYVKKEGKH